MPTNDGPAPAADEPDARPAPMRLRNVRVSDDLWAAADAMARANGDTVSRVIRRALAAYVRGEFRP